MRSEVPSDDVRMELKESEDHQDLIEDCLSLNPKFIKEIEARRQEHKRGRIISLHDLKKGEDT
jgi:hypothetical protein